MVSRHINAENKWLTKVPFVTDVAGGSFRYDAHFLSIPVSINNRRAHIKILSYETDIQEMFINHIKNNKN